MIENEGLVDVDGDGVIRNNGEDKPIGKRINAKKAVDYVISRLPSSKPVITSSLKLLQSPPYTVGQTLTAQFSITNQGGAPITLDVLTVGGRLNNDDTCNNITPKPNPNTNCADFTWKPNITLNPGILVQYEGILIPQQAGNYHFFTAYKTSDGIWNTSIPVAANISNTLDITVDSTPDDTTPPVRSNGSPSDTLPAGTTSTTLSLNTDENATCRYSTTSGISYSAMPNTFSTAGTISHSQTITSLTNGTAYNYYVRCQDTAGNVNTDDYRITFSIGNTPAAPTNAKAVGASNNILIQWDDNSNNETGFKIERKTGTTGTYSQTATVNADIKTFQDSGLTFGNTYCYRVRAYNIFGDSGYTNEACATTLATPVLSSPADGATITSNSVTLQWNNVTGAEGYGVDMGTSCGGTTILSNKATSTNSLIVSLTNGTYSWRVRASNGTYPGLSADSVCRSFSIVSGPTERITNGSFSSGTIGWTKWGDFWIGNTGTYPYDKYRTSPGYAAGGVNSSDGSAKDNALGYIYQNVTIPSNATSATLSFWYNITTNDSTTTPNDVLNVTIQNSTGTTILATVAALSNINNAQIGSYNQKTFDLTPYKGQTIRINFLATTNPSLPTTFRIDDVSVMADGNIEIF